MANIKYCRSYKSTNIWYVYGFTFRPNTNSDRCIVCYDNSRIWKKRNKMYIVEADESIKDILFSSDNKNNTLAVVMLNQHLKNKNSVLIDPYNHE